MSYYRSHLKAVVSIWLTNGNARVDGANEPREFCGGDWFEAQRNTEQLVSDGYCQWADPVLAKEAGYADIVPTAKGIYEALS